MLHEDPHPNPLPPPLLRRERGPEPVKDGGRSTSLLRTCRGVAPLQTPPRAPAATAGYEHATCSISVGTRRSDLEPNRGRQRNDLKSALLNGVLVSPRRVLVSARRVLVSPRRVLVSARRVLVSPRRVLVSPRRVLVSPRRVLVSARRVLVSARRVLVSARRVLVSARRVLVSPRRVLVSARRVLVPHAACWCPHAACWSPHAWCLGRSRRVAGAESSKPQRVAEGWGVEDSAPGTRRRGWGAVKSGGVGVVGVQGLGGPGDVGFVGDVFEFVHLGGGEEQAPGGVGGLGGLVFEVAGEHRAALGGALPWPSTSSSTALTLAG